MELTVFERILLLNILPQEGDITTLRIIHQLREDLSFSEDEHKTLEIRTEADRVFWKTEAAQPKEVAIGDKARSIIRESLEALNAQKRLREEHIGLYEKFVES